MNLVIPLHKWTKNNHTELRYALRGFQANLQFKEVVLIGDKPDWVKGIIHIPFPDNEDGRYRESNIFNKLQRYTYDFLNEPFIYANDDHFILQQNDLQIWPYAETLLQSHQRRAPDDPYRLTVKNTLQRTPPGINNYDSHCPCIFEPEWFKRLAQVDWRKQFGYCMKTLYAGFTNGLKDFEYPDLKINNPLSADEIIEEIRGRAWFSTSDKAFDSGMEQVMELLYPNPSRYEII